MLAEALFRKKIFVSLRKGCIFALAFAWRTGVEKGSDSTLKFFGNMR